MGQVESAICLWSHRREAEPGSALGSVEASHYLHFISESQCPLLGREGNNLKDLWGSDETWVRILGFVPAEML